MELMRAILSTSATHKGILYLHPHSAPVSVASYHNPHLGKQEYEPRKRGISIPDNTTPPQVCYYYLFIIIYYSSCTPAPTSPTLLLNVPNNRLLISFFPS